MRQNKSIVLPDSTCQVLRYRYPDLSEPERTYSALCLALSGRGNEIDWASWQAAEWRGFDLMVVQEGVGPLLYWLWEHQEYPDGIPNLEKQRLSVLFMQANARQQVFFKEVNRHILPALMPIITPLVLLKGAALAQVVYPHLALRPMGDLDILVRPEQVKQVVQRCKTLGYDQSFPSIGPTFQRVFEFHVHLFGAHRIPGDVEVHYALIYSPNYPYAPQMEWFWSQTEPLPGRPEVSWLSPTAQLLHLAAHLMIQHGEADMTLIKYYDIYALLTRYGKRIEWKNLEQQADRLDWGEVLERALEAVTLRFGTSWPEQGRPTGAPQPRRHLATSATGSVIERKSQITALSVLENLRIRMGALSWRDRLAVMWESVVPSPTYMRWRYSMRPAWLWPLTYFIRWERGILHAIRMAGLFVQRAKSRVKR